ncbi:MAG: hypothetical protein ACRCXN_11575 [Bacteroidales bacterium]
MNTRILIYLYLLLLSVSCSAPSKLDSALALAGENRKELEKVLEHYRDSGLKYEAAVFLIENMPYKKSVTYNIYNLEGEKVSIDSLIILPRKLLIDSVSRLSFTKAGSTNDIEVITSDYLIKNIDLSFKLKSLYPWCSKMSFADFCKTILPYRITSEPISDWKYNYYLKHKNVADSLAQHYVDLDQLVFYINEKYGKKYISKVNNLPSNVDYRLVESINGGTCDHLAHNAAQLMRSIGIPLHLDIMPYHGKVNGGHTYNSFYDEKNKLKFFSPYEREPERNRWIAPLILRVEFEIQKVSPPLNTYNYQIKNSNYRNVTSEYYPVSDYTFDFNQSEKHVYLTTFNRGNFKVVNSADVIKSKVRFKDVSHELLYFPMTINDKTLKPCLDPFYLTMDSCVILRNTNLKAQVLDSVCAYDGIRRINIAREEYTLMGWDNKWIPIAKTVSTDSIHLNFGKVKGFPLYMIQSNSFLGGIQRPFYKSANKYIRF